MEKWNSAVIGKPEARFENDYVIKFQIYGEKTPSLIPNK